ncbi:GDSL esterase/lipase At1g71250 isoform X2 [Magnolia sinica]|uniref:GDSL esterase/lipase At1g71250 isoform X2 n=1 Tax=Magnolia sinica TaxID=86752 RepID=UPI00265803E1|nr:GDSL esterase/lipase At1g71250 isoform X2 [Magnolia sinica]
MSLKIKRNMEKPSSRLVSAIARFHWFVAIFIFMHCSVGAHGSNQVPAMFVFGDSLVDVGNNNFLNSLAKANYFPYGIDYYQGATGRFCNGRTIVDFLGDLLGVPSLPAYADPNTFGRRILSGGDRFSLNQQVLNFENTLNDLRNQMDSRTLGTYLAKSIVFMVLGSNDYLNNYLLPSMYSSSYTYTPQQYADLLLNHYARQLVALYSLGLRKFMLTGVGPLGCIPNQLATGVHAPGRCVDYVNQIVGPYNTGLRSLVQQLNQNHPGAIFAYGNTYGTFADMLNNPSAYGFSVWDHGCCGIGRNQGQITCLPLAVPCGDRNRYIFWDAFHPTQAANRILAQRAFSGPPSDCYPINLQQMALL